MLDDRSRWRKTESWQYAATAISVAALLFLNWFGAWPFDASTERAARPGSALDAVLNDRVTIGFIRAAVVAVAAYVALSVPALVVDRRWMKGLGSSGLATDDARDRRRSVHELQDELTAAQLQIDELTRKIDWLSDVFVRQGARRDGA